MPLAELNIGIPKYPLDDPRIADFMHNLDRINSLAHRMPGFIWMHKDEEAGHAMYQETPWPGAAANLSVWDRAEDLEHFVWNTLHKAFYQRKAEWFEAMASHHFVIWTIPDGHRPTLAEAKQRLDHLDTYGDSDYAFGWSHLPHIKRWQTERCG